MDTGEEGEESLFSSSRAKLYGWESGAWKERGAGVLKFNATTSATEDFEKQEMKARFIMRAHQTYRILLNTPVFKQMTIGDPIKKGEEPTAKSLGIAVVTESGKPSPHLIRVSLQASPRLKHIVDHLSSSATITKPKPSIVRYDEYKSSSENVLPQSMSFGITGTQTRDLKQRCF